MFCTRTSRPTVELTKEALSRLQCFCSRRSLADLKVAPETVIDLDIALKSLGEAVKLNEC